MDETFVDYRLRLRELCEDFALVNNPRTLREMYGLWKKGLRSTRWEMVIDQLRYDPYRRRNWSMLETIYTMELIMMYHEGEPRLREATFLLKNDGNPPYPDYRVWEPIGPLLMYIHDDQEDHVDWIMAKDSGRFRWLATYLDIMPPPVEIRTPPASDVGLQIGHQLAEEEPNGDANMEEENEEEEEEDPEEDPNWEVEAGAQEQEPMRVEEDPHQVPNPPVWNFNQELQLPENGRVETEVDPRQWTDIHEIGAYVERIDEEREQEMARNQEEESFEERRAREAQPVIPRTEEGRNQEEEEEGDQEELARPPRRRRLTVRAYLSQFIRRDDEGTSGGNQGGAPPPQEP